MTTKKKDGKKFNIETKREYKTFPLQLPKELQKPLKQFALDNNEDMIDIATRAIKKEIH